MGSMKSRAGGRTRVKPVPLLVSHLGIYVRWHHPVIVVVVEVGALPREYLNFLQVHST